jgi:hypothetical protein
MVQNLLEKLQLKDEKNLLIQGLPSSIEKQFSKLSFAKNLTPLLKSKKIDFSLVFAVNEKQLNAILAEVIPALNEDGKLWVAYPKSTSKIVTDLNRDASWAYLGNCGFTSVRQIGLDHVWTAMRFNRENTTPVEKEVAAFTKENPAPGVNYEDRTIVVPDDLAAELKKHKTAMQFFEQLSFTNKKEYVQWIVGAKKEATREKRLKETLDRLKASKKNPTEK